MSNYYYAKDEGKSADQLYAELKEVYDAYSGYNDPAYGGGDFTKTVLLFAGDDFYKLHYVAKRYLALTYQPRRLLVDDEPDGYMESNLDYLANNHRLAVALLDAYASKLGDEVETTEEPK